MVQSVSIRNKTVYSMLSSIELRLKYEPHDHSASVSLFSGLRALHSNSRHAYKLTGSSPNFILTCFESSFENANASFSKFHAYVELVLWGII